MKKIRNHKLALRREAIRTLDVQLAMVVGGEPPVTTHGTGQSQDGGICPSAGVTLCVDCTASQRPLC